MAVEKKTRKIGYRVAPSVLEDWNRCAEYHNSPLTHLMNIAFQERFYHPWKKQQSENK